MIDIGSADEMLELTEPYFDAPPLMAAIDERRMHERAYAYWVSLLDGRTFPSVADLDPSTLDDFAPHSVLLDFTQDHETPTLRYIGKTLREECGLPVGELDLKSVPTRSLISRLTDHFFEIIANRAPIGFEAEFVSQRGNNTLYRGILMPLSSDGADIDFIYGVINWKELADTEVEAQLVLEAEAMDGWRLPPSADAADSLPEDADHDWADAFDPFDGDAGLPDRLAQARAAAQQVQAQDQRSRGALYRALGQAYDFYLASRDDPQGYAMLLDDAGIRPQARAPMTAVAKLVFGIDYDKARLTEFAAALAGAARADVALGGFATFVEQVPGGLKAIVAAERVARRAERDKPLAPRNARIKEDMRAAPVLAHIRDLKVTDDAEFILLVARRDGDQGVAVIDAVPHAETLIDAALTRLRRA